MKKYILLLLPVLSLISCDKIAENEYLQSGSPLDTNTTVSQRNILLEDYTGQFCGNCPEAADLASQLQKTYGNRIIVMGVHAGFFADPKPSGKYTTDFTNAVSKNLDGFFRISASGNPNGMVNRKNFPETQHIYLPDQWGAQLVEELAKPLQVNLNVNSSFSGDSIILNSSSRVVLTSTNPLNLVAYVVEDSLTGWQKDYRYPEAPDRENYAHRHVLRGSMNGTYGEEVFPANAATNSAVNTRLALKMDPVWKKKNITLVVAILDAVTMEILQVQEIHPSENE